MDGFDSGGHNRRKRRLEQFRRLDAVYLQKHGILKSGWRGLISWTTESDDKPSIKIEGGRDTITLDYRTRLRDVGEWTHIRDSLRRETPPPRLGRLFHARPELR